MAKFKIGDVVQLKSGGAPMTVNGDASPDTDGNDRVHCVWHAGKKHESHMYLVEALELLPDPAKKK